MSENELHAITASGSGKSEAEVAFELVSKLKGQGVWGERNMSDILDMYAECLDAAKGLRAYEGQKRVEVAIRKEAGEPILQVAPPQTPVNLQPQAARRQAPPVQAQQTAQQAPAQHQVQQMAMPPQQQAAARQAVPHQPVAAQSQAYKPA